MILEYGNRDPDRLSTCHARHVSNVYTTVRGPRGLNHMPKLQVTDAGSQTEAFCLQILVLFFFSKSWFLPPQTMQPGCERWPLQLSFFSKLEIYNSHIGQSMTNFLLIKAHWSAFTAPWDKQPKPPMSRSLKKEIKVVSWASTIKGWSGMESGMRGQGHPFSHSISVPFSRMLPV